MVQGTFLNAQNFFCCSYVVLTWTHTHTKHSSLLSERVSYCSPAHFYLDFALSFASVQLSVVSKPSSSSSVCTLFWGGALAGQFLQSIDAWTGQPLSPSALSPLHSSSVRVGKTPPGLNCCSLIGPPYFLDNTYRLPGDSPFLRFLWHSIASLYFLPRGH